MQFIVYFYRLVLFLTVLLML